MIILFNLDQINRSNNLVIQLVIGLYPQVTVITIVKNPMTIMEIRENMSEEASLENDEVTETLAVYDIEEGSGEGSGNFYL